MLIDIAQKLDPTGVEKRVDELLSILHTETAVLTRTPWGWRFPHLSLAQYFAAVEATRTPTAWKQLVSRPFAVNLADVTVLAAAYLDVIRADDTRRDELIRAVLQQSKRPGRYGAIHPSLIGRLVLETEQVGASLYSKLVRRWCDLVFKAAYGRTTNAVVEQEAREVLDAMQHHPRADLFREVVVGQRPAVNWDRRTRDVLEPALTDW